MAQKIRFPTFLSLLLVFLAACTAPTISLVTPGAETAAHILPVLQDPYPYPPPYGNNIQPEVPQAYPYPSVNQAVANPAYPSPAENVPPAWSPQPGDASLVRGKIFLSKSELTTMESNPPQFNLNLKGTLPTQCHQLRIQVNPPDSDNRIQVDGYSLSKPGEICVQVLAPFEAQVPLAGLPSGKYSVWVNGEKAGELQVP